MRTNVAWLTAIFVAIHADAVAGDRVFRNPFNDPFLQVTSGLAACPVPEEPVYREDEYQQLAHDRSQRGVSCWLDGRCRLHNSYLYDAEIIPRVQKAILASGKFKDTSIWALGQRRRVRLKGCVRTAEQAREVEALVRRIDDVEGVDNELMIGVGGAPPYAVRGR
ncbi:MAG: hypothetical protein AMXMBFR72_29610 [Betaproteobacteria bacterium]